MKKFLLSLVTLLVLAGSRDVQAQCDLALNNLVIQPVSATPYPNAGGSQCQAVFNASFDITTNSGFKYLFFHSWLAADYPNSPIFDCSGNTPARDPGTSVQLGTTNLPDPGKSFLDIGMVGLKEALAAIPLNTPTNVTSLIATTYLHDNTVVLTHPGNSPGLTAFVTKLADNILHFEVTNITIYINQPCGAALAVKTDIWGSNSNAGDPKAQCYICGITQFFNDPSISGFKTCDQPARRYALGLDMVQQVDVTVTYSVFIDMNDDGDLDLPTDPLAFTSAPITLNAANNWHYDVGLTPIALPSPYSDSQPYSEKGYLIVVSGAQLPNSVMRYFPHPQNCIGLPVDFKSFTATRQRTNVSLRWETLVEQDNSGFAVERKLQGNWEEIAFLPSRAQGGNSDEVLAYSYNDPNDHKGVSQYRIRQVDLDGKSKFSLIRAVRGQGQSVKTIVYPNPSADGKITVVFEERMVSRDITLSDISGRVIRQWKGVTNNNIQIDNLHPGIFTLRILVPGTGEQGVEKIVVNKR
jgi:hypothetical protein